MKFLLNENIPPSLTESLKALGYEASHVKTCGLLGVSDLNIIEHAEK